MSETKDCILDSVSKRLLIAMKDCAVIENDELSRLVFSAFELMCILNDHITEYRIRKCLKELQASDYITKAGFNAC